MPTGVKRGEIEKWNHQIRRLRRRALVVFISFQPERAAINGLYSTISGTKFISKVEELCCRVPKSRNLFTRSSSERAINALFESDQTRTPTVAIGGMCLLATADLEIILHGQLPDGNVIDFSDPASSIGYWVQSNLPRFDQIRDSVGADCLNSYFVIFEDANFAELISKKLGFTIPQQKDLENVFRDLGERSVSIITRWLETTASNKVGMTYAFTSDERIRAGLRENVRAIATKTGDTEFLSKTKAPINTMYTQMWVDLLKRTGILEEDAVAICSEPIQHLSEVLLSERNGYRGAIQKYLATNPWGVEGRDNELFSVLGFIPTVARTKSRQSCFSRYYQATEVFSKGKREFEPVQQVFPLYSNPIVRDALNYLFFDGESLDNIARLVTLEKERIRTKKEINGAGTLNRNDEIFSAKKKYEAEGLKICEKLNQKIREVYSYCYGGN